MCWNSRSSHSPYSSIDFCLKLGNSISINMPWMCFSSHFKWKVCQFHIQEMYTRERKSGLNLILKCFNIIYHAVYFIWYSQRSYKELNTLCSLFYFFFILSCRAVWNSEEKDALKNTRKHICRTPAKRKKTKKKKPQQHMCTQYINNYSLTEKFTV